MHLHLSCLVFVYTLDSNTAVSQSHQPVWCNANAGRICFIVGVADATEELWCILKHWLVLETSVHHVEQFLNCVNTRQKFLTCHLCSSVSVAHWPSDPLHDLHPGAAVFEVKGHLPRDDVTPAAAATQRYPPCALKLIY